MDERKRRPLEGAEAVGGRIEIHRAEDGPTAVYLDGRLVDCWKDEYNAIEAVLTFCGVDTVDDDAFMLGQKERGECALALEEVADFRDQRDQVKARAAEKRAEADRLVAEAAELDPQGHAELLRSIKRATQRDLMGPTLAARAEERSR